jgi:hypothetical protein
MRTVALPFLFITIVAGACLEKAHAWDYEAHRVVNQVALSALPSSFPAFVRTAPAAERIAFLGGEPDRWRNTPDLPLKHLNNPDHYFDVEDLKVYGIDTKSLPVFRYDFVAQTALFRARHPETFPASYEKNEDHTRELIGLLPWGMAEMYGKLKSGFSYLKAYQEHGGTPEQIANAQENIIYIMGVMGHLYGDACQPLHTTKHHHGWVGENPNGYSTSRGFHQWIDGGFWAATGGLDVQALAERARPAQLVQLSGRTAKPEEMFSTAVSFLVEQNKLVEPLYQLEKAGKLSGKGNNQEGRDFMEKRLLSGAQLLADTWFSAWQQAPPDSFLINQLTRKREK